MKKWPALLDAKVGFYKVNKVKMATFALLPIFHPGYIDQIDPTPLGTCLNPIFHKLYILDKYLARNYDI